MLAVARSACAPLQLSCTVFSADVGRKAGTRFGFFESLFQQINACLAVSAEKQRCEQGFVYESIGDAALSSIFHWRLPVCDCLRETAEGSEYLGAVSLLPASTAGVVRIPELPAFCDAWEKTQIGQMLKSDDMQPFLDAQRDRASSYFDTLDRKIGVKPQTSTTWRRVKWWSLGWPFQKTSVDPMRSRLSLIFAAASRAPSPPRNRLTMS